MTETLLMDAKGNRETPTSRAMSALAQRGVTYILPEIWEVVTFEAQLARWGHREMAKRYLELLRDHLNRSALGGL